MSGGADTPPDWLPPLLTLEDCGGDWDVYVQRVYDQFLRDFVDDRPFYRGRRVGQKRHPELKGKSATFWHITSEGKVEAERTPDLERCARVAWARAVIEHHSDPAVKEWSEPTRGEERVHLWVDSADYLVVLADRGNYVLLWTAYCVTYNHTRRKLQRRYEQYRND